MVYIYESHMGGLFITTEFLEDTYCEECGADDVLLWGGNDEFSLAKFLRNKLDVLGLGGYSMDYLQDIFNKASKKLKENDYET